MTPRTRNYLLGITVILILILVVCISSLLSLRQEFADMRPITLTEIASSKATAETETMLTQTYGEQVSRIIEDFKVQRHSLEFIKGTGVDAEITTGYYYQLYGGGPPTIEDGSSWLEEGSIWKVVTSAQVRHVRVIEYTPERIKAVAAVDRVYDNRTIEGDIVEASLTDYQCGVYVFVNEDNLWKLAGFFLTTPLSAGSVYNQWQYVDQEMKDVIGELPGGDLCPPPSSLIQ